jgi:zinc/manganese transport system substrate-binding protein
MRRRTVLAGGAAWALPPLSARAAGAAELPVVATFSILADLARTIGGAGVRVTSFVGPDADAHTFEPRPSDLLALQAARLLVVNGLGLEGWMSRLAQAAGYTGATVVASTGVRPRMIAAGEPDPHAWQNPANGVIYVHNIAEGLAAADPARAESIRAAAARLTADIQAADAFITRTIGAIPPAKRRIITSHDAFGYYGARYGIEFRAAQGIDTDTEPSARALAILARQIRADGIKAVFIETMTDPRLARTLAREAGATVGPPVYSDALSKPGGPADTYVKMLRYNTEQFARAMAAN